MPVGCVFCFFFVMFGGGGGGGGGVATGHRMEMAS